MPRRIDPRFAVRLRELRRQREMSLRKLAGAAFSSKSHLQEFETGAAMPGLDTAQRIDDALGAHGELVALVEQAATPLTADDRDRLDYVARHPRRIDTATIDSLASVLAHQRRLEDAVGSTVMLRPTLAQLRAVEGLVVEARGATRPQLVDVAAQWAQFAGWLHATANQPERAKAWYARALEWATEVGDADMIATALNLRGHLAWKARQPGQVIGLSAASLRQPASPGVRALAAQQQARGHALLGEADEVERLFGEADKLAHASADHRDQEPPWIYFYNGHYLRMQRGLAYLLLGEHERAIEHLGSGMLSMPEQVRRSEWVGAYVIPLAIAHLEAGNRDEALRLVEEARAIAAATDSPHLATQAERLAVRLSARH